MGEVNTYWQRNNQLVKTLTAYGYVLAVAGWPISYYASFPAAKDGQGVWFAALSIVTFLGALGVTIATIIGTGIVLTDKPPLEGANR